MNVPASSPGLLLIQELLLSYPPENHAGYRCFLVLGKRGAGKSHVLGDTYRAVQQKSILPLCARIVRPLELSNDPQILINALLELVNHSVDDQRLRSAPPNPEAVEALLESIPANLSVALFLDEDGPIPRDCMNELLEWFISPLAQAVDTPLRVIWAREYPLPAFNYMDVRARTREYDLSKLDQEEIQRFFQKGQVVNLDGYYLAHLKTDEFEDLQRLCLLRVYHPNYIVHLTSRLLGSSWRDKKWFGLQAELARFDLFRYSDDKDLFVPCIPEAWFISEYYKSRSLVTWRTDNQKIADLLVQLDGESIMQDLWWLEEAAFHLSQANHSADEIADLLKAALDSKRPRYDPEFHDPFDKCIHSLEMDNDLHKVIGRAGIQIIINMLMNWRLEA